MSSELRWSAYFMEMAYLVASKSTDDSIKVGCVLATPMNTVGSTGYNGFPRGVDEKDEEHPERLVRPEKYDWTEHAERNCIYNAALNGVKTQHSTAYVTSHPCTHCARAFVQSGVVEVYVPTKKNDPFYENGRWDQWANEFAKGLEILKAAGVKVTHVV
jgi:dCMP deaminase